MSYGAILGQTPNLANAHGILPVENGGTGVDNLEDFVSQALPNYSSIRAIHKQVTTYFTTHGQNNVVVSANEKLGNIFGILIDVEVLSTIINARLWFGSPNASMDFNLLSLTDNALRNQQGNFMIFLPANGEVSYLQGSMKAINFAYATGTTTIGMYTLMIDNNFCSVNNILVGVDSASTSNRNLTFNAIWDFYFLYFDPNHMPS